MIKIEAFLLKIRSFIDCIMYVICKLDGLILKCACSNHLFSDWTTDSYYISKYFCYYYCCWLPPTLLAKTTR